jgi:16S rRNA (cytidine1402-2'-O)-methyltransferase
MPLAVCATPIGNLDDVTLRVLEELRQADVVLCEDTRHTRRLLERHGIEARLLSYHEHNEAKRTAELLPRLKDGQRVALVSDAGLPAVSDPGGRLVAAALDEDVPVTVLPGASAVQAALVASGFPADRYEFVGFLPRTEQGRAELWRELAHSRHTVVAFESPNRLAKTLASLAGADRERPVAVARELTKRHEEIVRGSAVELAERFAEGTRGEITLVIGPSSGEARGEEGAASEAVAALVQGGTPRKTAAEVVSRLTGVPRKRLYDESL